MEKKWDNPAGSPMRPLGRRWIRLPLLLEGLLVAPSNVLSTAEMFHVCRHILPSVRHCKTAFGGIINKLLERNELMVVSPGQRETPYVMV